MRHISYGDFLRITDEVLAAGENILLLDGSNRFGEPVHQCLSPILGSEDHEEAGPYILPLKYGSDP